MEATKFFETNKSRLIRYDGEFLTYEPNGFYRPVTEEVVRAEIRTACRWLLSTTALNLALDEIRAACIIDSHGVSVPGWLNGCQLPAREILPVTNGLLHLPTMSLIPHTSDFFTLSALSFAYDPNAPEPRDWLAFLSTLWPDDQQSIDTLQEVFGYMLLPDRSQQKIFLFVSPKRGGKGTIARLLTALLGQSNVAGPTLNSLGQNFGLQPLIGKLAAIISDARLGGRADQAVIAERLLAISGQDSLTVDRKFKEPWTGQLNAAFMILSNELPRIADASGALASRFIILRHARSFYGREDASLTQRLLAELPGVLNWSIEGWRRLKARGHFVMPASSQEALTTLEDLGSPISAFIRDVCLTGPGHEVSCHALYTGWRTWCINEGRDAPGTLQSFGRDLRSALPGLQIVKRQTVTGRREKHYQGVSLAPMSPHFPNCGVPQ